MLADSLLPFRQTAWILALIMQGWLLTAGCAPSSQATTPRGTDIVIFIDFSAAAVSLGVWYSSSLRSTARRSRREIES